jgi:hypothetical protein
VSTADEISVYSRHFDCSELAFRHLIQRLRNRYPRGWTSANGTKLAFEVGKEDPVLSLPTRVIVLISGRRPEKGRASLSINEEEDGVVVEIRDGSKYCLTRSDEIMTEQSIGSSLDEFLDLVAEEVANPIAPLEPGLDPDSPYISLVDETIHIEAFEGDRQDFHRLMVRLRNRHPQGWTSPSGERVAFGKVGGDPTFPWFQYWVELPASVDRSVRPKPCAVVHVQNSFEGKVTVAFRDSFDAPECTYGAYPLGRVFEEFCEFVVTELRSPVVPLQASAQLDRSDYSLYKYDRIIHREAIAEEFPYCKEVFLGILRGCAKDWPFSDEIDFGLGTVNLGLSSFLDKYWLEPKSPLGDDGDCSACIVVERSRKGNILNFLDGIDPRRPDEEKVEPIGLLFERFCAFVVKVITSDLYLSYYQPVMRHVKGKNPLSQTSLFRGDVKDFRRFVNSFICDNPHGWLASDGTRLQLNRGPCSIGKDGQLAYCCVETAAVRAGHQTGHYATLKAEEKDGQTLVTFRDAHRWRQGSASAEAPEPLGNVLEDFRKCVVEEMQAFHFGGPNRSGPDADQGSGEWPLSDRSADGKFVDGEKKHTGGVDDFEYPWEAVEDVGNDRAMVRMLHQGIPYAEMGRRLGITAKRVNNRLSELRRDYPEWIVPYRRQPRDKDG